MIQALAVVDHGMALLEITDDDIALLSTRERRELISRLSRTVAGLPSQRTIRAMRLRRMAAVIVSVIVLIPWTVYLAVTLPDRHVVRHWTLTWVGFDVLLLLVFASTALLGWHRRHLVVLGAFASGVLLVCDAWFDVTTAGPHSMAGALLSAVLVELPLAALLMSGAFRLLRLTATRLCLMEPGDRLWDASLPIPELAGASR